LKNFNKWLENRNISSVKNQVAIDRKNLGVVGFEGLKNIEDGLKAMMTIPGKESIARSLISGMAGKIAIAIDKTHPELAAKLRPGAQKFVAASIKTNKKSSNEDNELTLDEE